MHAILSYRGTNRHRTRIPDACHPPATDRTDLQYTAPLSLARGVKITVSAWLTDWYCIVDVESCPGSALRIIVGGICLITAALIKVRVSSGGGGVVDFNFDGRNLLVVFDHVLWRPTDSSAPGSPMPQPCCRSAIPAAGVFGIGGAVRRSPMEPFPAVGGRLVGLAASSTAMNVGRIDDAVDDLRLCFGVEKDTWLVGLQPLLLLYHLKVGHSRHPYISAQKLTRGFDTIIRRMLCHTVG